MREAVITTADELQIFRDVIAMQQEMLNKNTFMSYTEQERKNMNANTDTIIDLIDQTIHPGIGNNNMSNIIVPGEKIC